jgi:hypothetical protein
MDSKQMANSNADFPNQLQRDKDIMARDFYNAVQKGTAPVGNLTQVQGNVMVLQGRVFASKYNIRGKSMFGDKINTPKRTLKLGKDHYRISVNASAGWLAMMNRSTYQMRKPNKGALSGTVKKGVQQNFNSLVRRNENEVTKAVNRLNNKRY